MILYILGKFNMAQLSEKYKLRKANERGSANHGWTDVRFTFSFADYYDPQHMSYRSLRVINNDRISPDMGFGMHPHKDMEIISYIIEGELEHKDSMGNGSVIRAGEVQKITAGKGILHSAYNPSKDRQTVMYQIWIIPSKKGLTPSYEELALQDLEKDNGLKLFASNSKQDEVLYVNQDVRIYHGALEKEEKVEFAINPHRGVWIQMIDGALTVDDIEIAKGDGLAVDNVDKILLKSPGKCQFLLFDLK